MSQLLKNFDKPLTEKQCWLKLMNYYCEFETGICRPTNIDSYLYELYCFDIINDDVYKSMGEKTDDTNDYLDNMILYDDITYEEAVSILAMFCGFMHYAVDRNGVI